MSLSRLLARTTPLVAVLAVLIAFALAHADTASATSPEAAAKPDAAMKPEEVVRVYLESLQKGDFKGAYELLTPDMRGNLDEAKWVVQQTMMMKLAEVTIDSYRIFPARMDGAKAIVPNLLKSKDKFINQKGLNEYELYTLVQSPDKKWRIDQQALVETDAVTKWFPPDVKVE